MMYPSSPVAGGPVARGRKRAGFSFLELQVAFVLFAIALAGVCPVVVMQSRQLSQIEARLNAQTTYYLIPSSAAWARKLGAAASVTTIDPGPPAASPVLTIDNGQSGYKETGTGWSTQTNPGAFGGTYRLHAAGTGSNTATWTFKGLSPGWYKVEATWLSSATRATNAPYTLSDGSTVLGTLPVNQQLAPAGDVFSGSSWSILGTVPVASGTLRVKLTDQANGQVAADGVHIVPVQNAVQVLSLAESLTSENLTAQVSVTVQVP